MKVKLLEPIPGYEEIAEYRPINFGETAIGKDGRILQDSIATVTPYLVLTPKPLPVVEPPKWLGCVRDIGCVGLRFVVRVGQDGWLCTVNGSGFHSQGTCMVHRREVELYPTANIPITPELEALFKEPHGCNKNNI
jgi:hypothetical protein